MDCGAEKTNYECFNENERRNAGTKNKHPDKFKDRIEVFDLCTNIDFID